LVVADVDLDLLDEQRVNGSVIPLHDLIKDAYDNVVHYSDFRSRRYPARRPRYPGVWRTPASARASGPRRLMRAANPRCSGVAPLPVQWADAPVRGRPLAGLSPVASTRFLRAGSGTGASRADQGVRPHGKCGAVLPGIGMQRREAQMTGKVVLVTGAARRIGRAIALRLAAEGARVAIHYQRSETDARGTAEECGGAELFRANLESVPEIAGMFAALEERMGRWTPWSTTPRGSPISTRWRSPSATGISSTPSI